jgi:hypothetical protein
MEALDREKLHKVLKSELIDSSSHIIKCVENEDVKLERAESDFYFDIIDGVLSHKASMFFEIGKYKFNFSVLNRHPRGLKNVAIRISDYYGGILDQWGRNVNLQDILLQIIRSDPDLRSKIITIMIWNEIKHDDNDTDYILNKYSEYLAHNMDVVVVNKFIVKINLALNENIRNIKDVFETSRAEFFKQELKKFIRRLGYGVEDVSGIIRELESEKLLLEMVNR